MTAARIAAWALVAAGSLLVIAVAAALLLQPRGELYGDPYEIFDEGDDR